MRIDPVKTHADATRMDIHHLVRVLNENIGAVVVQAVTGSKDRATPLNWAKPDGPEPRAQSQQQLRLTYQVWSLLEQNEGRNVALAWLLGANPRLDNRTPVTAIRSLESVEVLGAAEAFIAGAAVA